MSIGVGLKLEGYPTDEEKFFWILAQESCHPKAIERILTRIRANGFDLLTVSDSLPFDWIKTALEEVKVTMSFIEPIDNWKKKYDDGDWDKEILEQVFELKRLRSQKI